MENENGTRRRKQFVENDICIEFDAVSENEGLARVVIAAFISRADPTLDELEDVKTAVSEAVTNAIIHGYREQEDVLSCGHISRRRMSCRWRLLTGGWALQT